MTKYNLCDCKRKFDCRKCNLNQNWNNNKRRCECKNSGKDRVWKEYYVWNPILCDCEYLKNYAYIKSNGSVIACDEIIDVADKLYNGILETVSIDSTYEKTK